MKPERLDHRYRLAIASRTLAAAAGGYAVAATVAGSLATSLALFMPRAEAVLTATMLSWPAYAAAIGWVFYARSARDAWLGTLAPAVVLGSAAMAPRWLASLA